jgi:hypothetical protein
MNGELTKLNSVEIKNLLRNNLNKERILCDFVFFL